MLRRSGHICYDHQHQKDSSPVITIHLNFTQIQSLESNLLLLIFSFSTQHHHPSVRLFITSCSPMCVTDIIIMSAIRISLSQLLFSILIWTAERRVIVTRVKKSKDERQEDVYPHVIHSFEKERMSWKKERERRIVNSSDCPKNQSLSHDSTHSFSPRVLSSQRQQTSFSTLFSIFTLHYNSFREWTLVCLSGSLMSFTLDHRIHKNKEKNEWEVDQGSIRQEIRKNLEFPGPVSFSSFYFSRFLFWDAWVTAISSPPFHPLPYYLSLSVRSFFVCLLFSHPKEISPALHESYTFSCLFLCFFFLLSSLFYLQLGLSLSWLHSSCQFWLLSSFCCSRASSSISSLQTATSYLNKKEKTGRWRSDWLKVKARKDFIPVFLFHVSSPWFLMSLPHLSSFFLSTLVSSPHPPTTTYYYHKTETLEITHEKHPHAFSLLILTSWVE